MLGIGEVWYFSSKTVVFSRNDGFTMLCDEQHCVLWWYLIDQCMLGIGEVWYFPSKQLFFHEMMISPCCVKNTIACCALHKILKSLFVCLLVSLSKPIGNELFYF
jgi:hypothetical protein